MKIIRPFTGTGGVFFPVGLPPQGTCEFSTQECRKWCYVNTPNYPDYDEEVRIPESEKWEIYETFINRAIPSLIDQILSELDGLQTNILHWFGSGDCMRKDVDRISEIIEKMRGIGIIQMGFTRNKQLWLENKDVFALTVDSKNEASDKNAMYALPQYKKYRSVMFVPSYKVTGGLCGPTVCRDRKIDRLEHHIDCRICLRLKTGCFDRRND